MISGSDLLWGGVWPGAVAALVLAIVWQLTGKAASAWRTALVVGYVAGHWALAARDIGASKLVMIGQLDAAGDLWAYDPRNLEFAAALTKSYQPTESRDWMPVLLFLAIAPDAFSCVGKRGPVLGWLTRVGLCLFLPWRLLNGSAYLPAITLPDFGFETAAWSTGEMVAWISGVAAALLLCWQLARVADQQTGNFTRSALAVVVALGGAATVALSASLIYGQLLGVLTAALAGCGLVSALLATGRGPAAAAGPVVIAFGSLMVLAHFFAELKLHNGALLLTAMALAIGWLPLPAKLTPRLQAACRSVVCLGVLAVAVTLAGRDFAANQLETEINPYQTNLEK